MLIGRAVTGWTFGSLTCGYTYHVPGRWGGLLLSRAARSRVRFTRILPVISRQFRTPC